MIFFKKAGSYSVLEQKGQNNSNLFSLVCWCKIKKNNNDIIGFL